jgi:hypothetical protein
LWDYNQKQAFSSTSKTARKVNIYRPAYGKSTEKQLHSKGKIIRDLFQGSEYCKHGLVSKYIDGSLMDQNGHIAKFINDKETRIWLSDNSAER